MHNPTDKLKNEIVTLQTYRGVFLREAVWHAYCNYPRAATSDTAHEFAATSMLEASDTLDRMIARRRAKIEGATNDA